MLNMTHKHIHLQHITNRIMAVLFQSNDCNVPTGVPYALMARKLNELLTWRPLPTQGAYNVSAPHSHSAQRQYCAPIKKRTRTFTTSV